MMKYGVTAEHLAMAEEAKAGNPTAVKLIDQAVVYSRLMGRFTEEKPTGEPLAELQREAGELFLTEDQGRLLSITAGLLRILLAGGTLVLPGENLFEIIRQGEAMRALLADLKRMVPESAYPEFDLKLPQMFRFQQEA